jgi:hypothetical protein
VAQLSTLGHERFWILLCWFGWRRFGQFDLDEQDFGSSFGFSSRWFTRRASAELAIGERWDLLDFIMNITISWPNKTLEPTADGAVRSAIAVHVVSRRWLSFLR